MFIGAFLAFYAFIGFEDIVHLGDEAKDARSAVPRAIFITLTVAFLFYILIATTAVSTLPPATLAESRAPLVDVVEATGMSGTIVGILSLTTIGDGLLAQIIMVSRTIYDLGKRRGGAPDLLAHVSRRTKTPIIATVLVGVTILGLALFFPTRTLAAATSSIILVVFAIANVALIRMKRRGKVPRGAFQAPGWIPYFGVLTCLILLIAQLFIGGDG